MDYELLQLHQIFLRVKTAEKTLLHPRLWTRQADRFVQRVYNPDDRENLRINKFDALHKIMLIIFYTGFFPHAAEQCERNCSLDGV